MQKFISNPLWRACLFTGTIGLILGGIGGALAGGPVFASAVGGLALGGFAGMFGMEMK